MSRGNTSNSPIRAAVYTRISSDPDGLEQGVERQEKDSRRMCHERGWEVREVFTDNDVSADRAKKPRKGYQHLLADMKAGKVDAVVCWVGDRLHRNLTELVEFGAICEDHSIILLTEEGETRFGQDDTMAYIKGVIAHDELRKMKVRMRRAKQQKAERGEWGGGRRPFGFDVMPGSPRGIVPKVPSRLAVNKVEAAHIRWGAKFLLDGGSLNGLRFAWMERGVETVMGARTRDGSQSHWTTGSISKILTSPTIVGLRHYKGEILGEAQWDAILDRDTWEAVCAILNDPSRQKRAVTTEWPLRGVLTCGPCGGLLYGKMRSQKQGGTRFYRCDRGNGGCGKAFVTASYVEEYATNVLVVMASSSETLSLLMSETKENDAELAALITMRSEDEAKLRRLDESALDDLLGDLKVDRRAIAAKRRELEKSIAARSVRIGALRGISVEGMGLGLADRWNRMTVDEHRRIFLALVSEIRVHPSQLNGMQRSKFDPSRITFIWRSGTLGARMEAINLTFLESFGKDYTVLGLVTMDGKAIGTIWNPTEAHA